VHFIQVGAGLRKNISSKRNSKDWVNNHGCSAKDMIVWISPSAGKENYEVGQEVADFLLIKYI
jgi:copper oxidase (laccase) domain-containing protein